MGANHEETPLKIFEGYSGNRRGFIKTPKKDSENGTAPPPRFCVGEREKAPLDTEKTGVYNNTVKQEYKKEV